MRVNAWVMCGMVALVLAANASLVAGEEDGKKERARLKQNIQLASQAAASFNLQAVKVAPSGGSQQQKRAYAEQTEFLRGGALRLRDLSERANVMMKNPKARAAEMAAMNLQFQGLQTALQMESRRFATLSQASKSRHDIAMNSIRNIK